MADAWKADSAVQITPASGGGSVAYAKLAGWSITRDVNKMITSWKIDFAEAIEIDEDARFTILRGIGSASVNTSVQPYWNTVGYGSTLVKNGKAEEWVVDAGDSSLAWGCSGKTGEIDYVMTSLKDAPQKDLYFVNRTWLNSLAGGNRNWRLVDGGLYWDTGQRSSDAQKIWPVEHSDLPGKDADPDTYEIIMDYTTHAEIAAYIANLMGYRIQITTPPMNLRSVMHFSSGQSYLDMLNAMFSMWNGDIKLDESNQDEPTIWVLDTAGPENVLNQPRSITVAARAIVSLSCKHIGKEKNPVDHVIVKGAKDWNTSNLPDSGELKRIRLTPIEMPEENIRTFQGTDSFSFAKSNKTMGDYTGGFNTADAEDQKRPAYSFHLEKIYVSPIDDGLYMMYELDQSFDEDGEQLSQHSVRYTYGPGYKLIYTSERESMRVQKPGEPFKEFMEVKHTVIDQSWIIDGLERVRTTELTEEPVVITEFYDQTSGKYIKAGPVPISRSQEQGRTAKNPASNQKIIDMTTSFSVDNVNRACKGLLAQTRSKYDTIAEVMKVSSQILRDPRAKLDDERTQYKHEAWLPGQTVYHKSVTIEHPDICDDITAQAIADRIFIKNAANIERRELSLTLVMPIQLPDTNFAINLPEMYATSERGGSVPSNRVTKRLMPAAKYVVSQIQESCSVGDSDVNYSQGFTLRNWL